MSHDHLVHEAGSDSTFDTGTCTSTNKASDELFVTTPEIPLLDETIESEEIPTTNIQKGKKTKKTKRKKKKDLNNPNRIQQSSSQSDSQGEANSKLLFMEESNIEVDTIISHSSEKSLRSHRRVQIISDLPDRDRKPLMVSTKTGEQASVSTIGHAGVEEGDNTTCMWCCCRMIPDWLVQFTTYVLWLKLEESERPSHRPLKQ